MTKKRGLIFLMLCISCSVTFGQRNFTEIKDSILREILIQGFDSSESLTRLSNPDYPIKSIRFRFDFSDVRLVNNDDAPLFYFTGADTSIYKIEDIEEIRYSYFYSFKKIEIPYEILYTPNREAQFLSKSTHYELIILSQLEKGKCSKCFDSVESFIKNSKIKNYKLAILTTNLDASEISNKFIWIVTEKKPNKISGSFFVSPITGKKVNTDKIFVAPVIK